MTKGEGRGGGKGGNAGPGQTGRAEEKSVKRQYSEDEGARDEERENERFDDEDEWGADSCKF